MFLFFNEENLQFLEMVLTYEMIRNFGKYMNLLLSEVYQSFFKHKLPRVLPLMKELLQFSPEKIIGDWFQMEEGAIIILYHTVWICLELIRKNLIFENEHFINFKKSYVIKFPWVVGPFIIKSKYDFPVVESLPK